MIRLTLPVGTDTYFFLARKVINHSLLHTYLRAKINSKFKNILFDPVLFAILVTEHIFLQESQELLVARRVPRKLKERRRHVP